MTERAQELGWLDGWVRTNDGWALEAHVVQGAAWERQSLPATWLLGKCRAFEPSMRAYAKLPSHSLRLHIPDLSRLDTLLKPGSQVVAQVPAARHTHQALYVADGGERQAYLPAILLIKELWAWTSGALDALLTPNSLAVCLRRVEQPEGIAVQASGLLSRVGGSDTSLRRLCWLAQSPDAQSSWSSVLTYAHAGEIRLRLPKASLEAWAWGVDLPAGFLVAELLSVQLRFELPQEGCEVRLGKALFRCPPASSRASGIPSV